MLSIRDATDRIDPGSENALSLARADAGAWWASLQAVVPKFRFRTE
jgi:hypothetical protein